MAARSSTSSPVLLTRSATGPGPRSSPPPGSCSPESSPTDAPPAHRHSRWRHGRLGRGVAACQRPGRRAPRSPSISGGWRLGGKGASSRGPTDASRSTGCTSGSATTTTPSGWFARSTRSSIVRAPTRTARSRTGATRSSRQARSGWGAPARPIHDSGSPSFPRTTGCREARCRRGELARLTSWNAGLRCSDASAFRSIPTSTAPTARAVLTSSSVHPRLARAATRPARSCSGARTGLRAVTGNGAAARRSREFIELLLTMLRGITVDRLTVRGYNAVDHLDLRDWLAGTERLGTRSTRRSCAATTTSRSPTRTATRPARASRPASALHLTMRMFLDYKGAMFWKMRAGMGDVVFAPLYQALRRRGVRFGSSTASTTSTSRRTARSIARSASGDR